MAGYSPSASAVAMETVNCFLTVLLYSERRAIEWCEELHCLFCSVIPMSLYIVMGAWNITSIRHEHHDSGSQCATTFSQVPH
jgi:hypothetical protein